MNQQNVSNQVEGSAQGSNRRLQYQVGFNRIAVGLAVIGLTALAVGQGCSPKHGMESAGSQSSTGGGGGGGGGGVQPPVPEKAGPTVGVRNFDSIYANLVNLTGISAASCAADFNEQRGSLPEFHDVGSLTGNAQGALIKVAGCACQQSLLANGNPGRATLTPGFPYNKTASTLTDQEIASAVTNILNVAWGPAQLSRLPDRTAAINQIFAAVKDVITADQTPASTAATTRAIFAACTIAFSAPSAQIL